MIIATAGHVDHGKTALVKALTNIDTDRLPEEKARGLSIDLGFAYQSLSENTTLGFVDVPGHEKFIRNMLAGVAGIDLGMLVVAADDGVMPQTREHFAILNLLGIKQCVVAITKIDRVAENRVTEVKYQIETLLNKAGLKETAVYPVCAIDNQGIDTLKLALCERAKGLQHRSVKGFFRMAIDRVFSLKGVGLVVTGMVFSGRACVDESLVLSSDGTPVRVRGIRSHNVVSQQAQAGERCAINIAGRGISEASVSRGHWLFHANLHVPTRRIDVSLQVLDSELKSLKHWTPTHLHIGADHRTARVAVLSGGSIAPGETGLAQLVLEHDVFSVHGDRFVLRDQSASRTIAGGYVIDPFSPKRGRARPARIVELKAMDQNNVEDVLLCLAKVSEIGVSLNFFSISHNLLETQVDAMIKTLSLQRIGNLAEGRVFHRTQWHKLLRRVEAVVSAIHQSRPESPGGSLKDIQLTLKPYIEELVLEAVINKLLDEKRLGRRGARFHLPSHNIEVSERDRQLWTQAEPSLAPKKGSPLSLHQAAEAIGVDKKILESSLKIAVKMGEMTVVAKNRYLPNWYMMQLASAAQQLVQNTDKETFTVSEYCEKTMVGRNFAIDLLEYFDRKGFTERIGNNRRIKNSGSNVFNTTNTNQKGRGSHPGGAPGLQIQ